MSFARRDSDPFPLHGTSKAAPRDLRTYGRYLIRVYLEPSDAGRTFTEKAICISLSTTNQTVVMS